VWNIAAPAHGGTITDGWVLIIVLACLAGGGYVGYLIGLLKSQLNSRAEETDNEALRREQQSELIERLAHASTEEVRRAVVLLAKTSLHSQWELNNALDTAEGKEPAPEE
jgi:hypothetical protein